MDRKTSSSRARPSRRGAQVPDGAADIARRFGVTIKALRLYENLGLLKPNRTQNGWRTYGHEDCERLHRIVSLRQLGLPLAAIAELFGAGGQGLAETLTLQEQALLDQRAKADEALAIVRRAKARVAAGEALDADALAELVQRVNAAKLKWTPQLEAVADRTLKPRQRRRLAANTTPELQVEWAEFYPDLAALSAIGDPAGAAALAMGRRANDLIGRMTGGDPSTLLATRNFWLDGLSRPELARDMPMTAAQWAFLGQVMALLAAGEADQ
jgi:DNA-binding transcriptional MerR regulator